MVINGVLSRDKGPGSLLTADQGTGNMQTSVGLKGGGVMLG